MSQLPYQLQVSLISGIVNLLGLTIYAVFTWRALHSRNQNKPLRFAWLLWCLLGATYLSYQLSKGSFEGLPLLVAEQIGITVIFLLTLRYGDGKLRPESWKELFHRAYWSQLMGAREWVGLFIAVPALLLLWFSLGSPLISLWLSLLVDWMAASPTIWQASKEAGAEPWYAWACNAAASAGTIYGLIHHGPWPQFIYPASLLAMSLGVIIADQKARFDRRRRTAVQRRQCLTLCPSIAPKWTLRLTACGWRAFACIDMPLGLRLSRP